MKICIGSNIVDGLGGGGNLFLKNLKNYLIENNIEVVFNLDDKDIDLILFTDPRSTFGPTSSIKKAKLKIIRKK